MRRNFQNGLSRALALFSLSLLLASPSSAYYYYVHYNTGSGTFTPILEKFDLSALNNKTVPFFISGQGPSKLYAGDSFLAIVSEIRAAAAVWNSVSTSTLRLGYGGMFTVGTSENAPAIHVEFSDEIPPGLLALSGPETQGNVRTGADGVPFVPIVRSKMLLRSELNQVPGPSYSELFFTTVVHEFGHTMGLQHSLTSSVMSTAVTSASTKAAPLAQDDIAAISLLYPAAGYAATVGSISGQVSLSNGTGVGLASVVAIAPGSAPVSALTNPDGSFEIDGLPQGQYYLYVHPLPPAQLGEAYPGNIRPPEDMSGNTISSGPTFATQFYPGTQNFNQAQLVSVTQGNITGGIFFTVRKEGQPAISAIRVYGYSADEVPLSDPQMFSLVPAALVAGGPGLLNQDGSVVSGLTLGTLGTSSAIVYNMQPYYPPYISFDLYLNANNLSGPQHLLFSTPKDLYVLPCAFTIAQNQPPLITGVTGGTDGKGNRIVTLTGSNFQTDTRIFFDGQPTTVLSVTAGNRMVVTPPPAPAGFTANVMALNSSDPQSSLFLQPTPLTYTYDHAAAPAITATPAFLAPGEDTLVDIYSQNFPFVKGQLAIGFGSSDVQVKSVKVLNQNHAQIVASVPAGDYVSTSFMTITNGLSVFSYTLGFTIQQP